MSTRMIRRVILAAGIVGATIVGLVMMENTGIVGTITVAHAAVTCPTSGSADDGCGALTVTPTSVIAGASGRSFTFVFDSGPMTFPSNSLIRITFPSGWTAPTKSGTAGVLSLSAPPSPLTGCNTPASMSNVTVSGMVVTINLKCQSPHSGFRLTYSNVTAPNTSGPYTFATATQAGGGGKHTLVQINASPVITVVQPPRITVPASGTATNAGTAGAALTVSGTAASQYSTITIYSYSDAACTVAGVKQGTATVNGGTWVASLTGLTAEGTYYLGATASGSGVVSSQSNCVAVTVDRTVPTSTIAFPTTTFTNAAAWANGCNGTPWTYSFTVCGYATDTGTGVVAVGVLIQSTGSFQHGNYWNASACTWQSAPFWNLATSPSGTGGSGLGAGGSGFGAGGSGLGAGGACPTSSGGSGLGAGGSGLGAGGSGFGAGGSGFGAGGSGFGAGGSGFGAGGSTTGIPWDLPTGLPADGKYLITSQAVDAAGNFEPYNSGCSAGPGNCSQTAVDTTAPTSSITFPSDGSSDNATTWATGCNTPPWNVAYAICGYASDAGSDASGIQAVGILVQSTNANFHFDQYWNGSTCTWQNTPFWNLAGSADSFSNGTGSGSGFGGSGFGAGGACYSAGGAGLGAVSGSGFGAGGSGLGAGGSGLGAGGSGFGAGGSGFGAGGSGLGAGGGTNGTPWLYVLTVPPDGTYTFTTQAEDKAGNFQGATCSSGVCQSATTVETIRPTANFSVNGQTQSGALNIDPNSIVHIFFSQPMNQGSLAGITLTSSPASGSFSATCTDGGLCESVTMNAAGQLSPSTVYTLTLPSGSGGVTDASGNALDPGDGSNNPQTFTFTTGLATLTNTADSDGDGIPDAWDGTSFPGPNGTTINTQAWGFSPTQKDLCVVENYMQGKAVDGNTYDQHISQQANQAIVNAFANNGVHLVIFEGAFSAGLPSGYSGPYYGGSIPMTDPLGSTGSDGSYNWNAFMGLRTQYFVPSGLSQICHYMIASHDLGGNGGAGSISYSTGSSQGFGTSDFVVAMGTAPADAASGTPAGVGTMMEQAGTVMHELGHNLGLHHGGNTDTNYKPNYASVMNYFFQFSGVIGGTAPYGLDYSHGAMGSLDKSALSDSAGIPSSTGFGTKYWCYTITGTWVENLVVNAATPINWGCLATGPVLTGTHAEDINHDGTTGEILYDYNDWAHLQFSNDGTIGWGDSSVPPSVLPPTQNIDTDTTDATNNLDSLQSFLANNPTFGWSGFLPPLNSDSTGTYVNVGNDGSTFPIKFQLKDSSGNYLTNTSAVRSISWTPWSGPGGQATGATTTAPASAISYDSTNNQFIYNWKSPSTPGAYYMIQVTLADGSSPKLALIYLT